MNMQKKYVYEKCKPESYKVVQSDILPPSKEAIFYTP